MLLWFMGQHLLILICNFLIWSHVIFGNMSHIFRA